MGRIRVCFTGYSDIREEDCGEVAHALADIISDMLRRNSCSQFYFTGEGQFDWVANSTVKSLDFIAPQNRRERVFYTQEDFPFDREQELQKQYDKVMKYPLDILRLCDVLVAYGGAFNKKSADMVSEARKLYKPIIYI